MDIGHSVDNKVGLLGVQFTIYLLCGKLCRIDYCPFKVYNIQSVICTHLCAMSIL